MSIQTGVITNNTLQQNENVRSMMPDQQTGEIHHSLNIEAVRALEISNRLHSTLDLNKLFEMYTQEAQIHVNFDSFEYTHPEDIFSFLHGSKSRHNCQYRLLMGGENLGELTFSRRKKFTDSETVKLEYLLSSLLNPLHNSLMYKQAVTNALLDPLTGTQNRTAFDNSMGREVSLAHRHNNPLGLIVLDIDFFKKINDKHGHLFGDCVLRDVAREIKRVIRDSDMAFRYGGEEFVIMLSNTSPKGAKLLAERLRKAIDKLDCCYAGKRTHVSVSLGVACLEKDETETRLFERADAALYQSKESGRNQTTIAS